MPRKRVEQVHQKNIREKERRAPTAIFLRISDKKDYGRIYDTVIDTFRRISILTYDLPLNGWSLQFEKVSKDANYLFILGQDALPEEINKKIKNIIMSNHKIKIIVQDSVEISACTGKKINRFKTAKELKKEILSWKKQS